MKELKTGDTAPAFSLPAGHGGTIALKDLKGKSVVLYFYPKDNTSGCTKEACAFNDSLARIKKKGAAVIGVSPDSPASHAKFAGKFDLTFPLVSDESKKMLEAYGVWKEKSMYGRKYMGVERSTFIIDGKGVITHVFRKVQVDGHVDEVLAALTNS